MTSPRKLRNRLSQQAFRARQSSDINELKQRLAQFSTSESDRNTRLARENQALRQQLFHCEQKLRSLQATLKDIINNVATNRNTEIVSNAHRVILTLPVLISL